MNKKNILIIIAVIFLSAISYSVYNAMMYVDTDNAEIDARAILVSAKVTGHVIDVLVNEGQKVKKGTILALVDNRDYTNRLIKVKAELDSLKAKRDDSERNFKRLQELYKKEAVSAQVFDQAKSVYNELKSKFDSLKAEQNEAELNLSYTEVRAMRDGYIAKRSVEVGQLVSLGVPLFGFTDAKERSVVANFKETDIENIKVGAKAFIEVDALPKKIFEGLVESLSSATGATFTLLPPDNATGNFTKVVQRIPVRIAFKNLTESDIENLKAGLSATVRIKK